MRAPVDARAQACMAWESRIWMADVSPAQRRLYIDVQGFIDGVRD